ncbi:MAG TPA: helix-turn-helix transcriptional regulator [Gemmatimonadaceae bacterium]|jgi:DNA-binding PadR family transcriptional regulator|nr:helix-turn-helix transcriptional regulator [Gemmatimonadaceae bacterium]
MTSSDFALPQGTLETLVLKTLSGGPMHGYGVGLWIETTSQTAISVEEGSLCPALRRMEKRGWVQAEW